MNPPPSFPTPPQKKRTWWSRNWPWALPLTIISGVMLLAGGCVGFVVLLFGVMKSSDVYKNAVTRAEANPRVISAIGSPIKEGYFLSGNINVTNDSGNANIAVPISGPGGKGTIYAVATKSEGVWSYSTLDVVVQATGQKIDLNEKAAAASSPAPVP